MRNTLIHVFFALSTMSLFSQNWCPPGATWHFRKGGLISDMGEADGVIEMRYNADTVLAGVPCKRLNGVFRGKKLMGGPVTGTNVTIPYNTHYTYDANNVIFLFNGSGGFDTLVDFNALPGDRWLKPRSVQTGCVTRPVVTVTDTGHISINGFYLKKLKVIDSAKVMALDDTTVYTYAETNIFIERILFDYWMEQEIFPTDCELDPSATDGPASVTFRCYQDNNFPVYVKNLYHPQDVFTCTPFVGFEAYTIGSFNPLVFPNPNSGSFQVELQQAAEVSVLNALGQICYLADFAETGKIMIEIPGMAPGAYLVRLKTRQGTAQAKLVRQ